MRINRPDGGPGEIGPDEIEPQSGSTITHSENAAPQTEAHVAIEALDAAISDPNSIQNPTRTALTEIARAADLETVDGQTVAVRKSAQWIIRSKFKKNLRSTRQADQVVEELGEQVTADPIFRRKILSILDQIQAE